MRHRCWRESHGCPATLRSNPRRRLSGKGRRLMRLAVVGSGTSGLASAFVPWFPRRDPEAGPVSAVPELRVRAANDRPVNGGGRWVLYWMIAARRTSFSFALEHAADRARELGLRWSCSRRCVRATPGPRTGCTASCSTAWPTPGAGSRGAR